MNHDPVQACKLNVDTNRLKDEALRLFEETSENLEYGNNRKWEKIHLWDCYNKDGVTKPELWGEINTMRSMMFHTRLNVNNYIFRPNSKLYQCPYLKEILDEITGGKIEQATVYICDISLLQKRGRVETHKDQNIRPYMSNETKWKRFHIPIITNENVHFTVHDKTYHLQEGMLYKLRTTLPHSVANHSDLDRYHLIIDMDPACINKNLKWFTPSSIS
jgi:hypothetical protein